MIILANHYAFEIDMVYQVILISFVSLICQLLRRKSIPDLVGRLDISWLKELGQGLLIGAVLMLLPAILMTMLGYITWQANENIYSTIVSGFKAYLFAVLAEELLFRGFVFQRLIQSVGKWPAQVLIGGLFVLTHIDNPGMSGITKTLASINIFLASLMFGIAYLKTKSMAMPLGIHLMANFMQGTILGFGVSGEKDSSLLNPVFQHAPVWISGGEFGIEGSILGLVALTLLTALIYFWYPEWEEQTYFENENPIS